MATSVLVSSILLMVSNNSGTSSGRNFSFVIREGIDKHFNTHSPTCILYSETDRYPYINEFFISVSKHLSEIVINNCSEYKDFGNLIALNFDYFDHTNPINDNRDTVHLPKTNFLFYFDESDNIGINLCEEFLKQNLSFGDKFGMFFRSLIICEYTSAIGTIVSELWVKNPWSDQRGRRIRDATSAYFNRKPNLHGKILRLIIDHVYVSTKTVNIYDTILEKFNASKYIIKFSDNMPNHYTNFYLVLPEKPVLVVGFKNYWTESLCIVVQKGHFHPLFWCCSGVLNGISGWVCWLCGSFVVLSGTESTIEDKLCSSPSTKCWKFS